MSKISFASCVILDDYGRILLLHRNSGGESGWELPGGRVEDYESAEESVVREIDEGLGIAVRLTKTLGSGEFEGDYEDYSYTWFQAVIVDADPQLRQTDAIDDLEYFETEDLLSIALAHSMQILFDKIMSGEVVLDS